MRERRSQLLLIGLLSLTAMLLRARLLAGHLGNPPWSAGNSPASVVALSSVSDSKFKIQSDFGELPLSFKPNQGQTDAGVRFVVRGMGYTAFLTDDEAVLAFQPLHGRTPAPQPVRPWGKFAPSTSTPSVLRMRFVGGNLNARIVGIDELPGRTNYFIGNNPEKWRTNVPNYSRVEYHNVYPGVDLVYHGNHGQLEYDLVVEPGADPSQIKVSFAGTDRMRVDPANGDLVLKMGDGEVRFHKPKVFQPAVLQVPGPAGSESNEVLNNRSGSGMPSPGLQTPHPKPLSCAFVLAGNNQVSFRVAGYDTQRALVIDPVLSYSTYLGGSGYEAAQGIAVDSSGNAYVTGDTASLDFPTVNPLERRLGRAMDDAFVAKLNSAGSAFVYSTYLGGSGSSSGTAIAVDSSGNAYVVGNTTATDFPMAKPFQATNRANPSARYSAFVTKLNSTGTALVHSTYLGGSAENWGYGIAVDSSGSAYVTGSTLSTDFPTVVPFQATNKAAPETGAVTAFVAKLNPAGSGLVYSTYLGGSDGESGQGIAVDSSGDAYVTGYTSSTDFPTVHPLQASDRGDYDAFVAKLNSDGSALVYSTYLGGSGVDYGYGIAVDSFGNAYVTGRTYSTDFPTAHALQKSYGGELDAFVAKLNAAGSALVYSTYLGGSEYDEGNAVAVDSSGNAYVTGVTYSTNFPTANAFQPHCGGCSLYADAFVAKLNSDGSALVYSTYLGGSAVDYGYGIAVDSFGNAYVTGQTSSTDYPTVHPLQASNHGAFDAFVAKIAAVRAHSRSLSR